MLASFGKLLRVLSGKGDPAAVPAPTEIIPVFDTTNPGAELLFNRDVRLFAGGADEAAVVGNRSQVAINNPSGSGTIVVLDHWQGRSTRDRLYIRQCSSAALAAFDADGNRFGRDPRVCYGIAVPPLGGLPVAQVLSDQAGAVGDVVVATYPRGYDGASYYWYEGSEPFVVLPGTGLVFNVDSDNYAVGVALFWHERRITPEERRSLDSRYFV